jgi:Fe-S-cluster containining protein
VERAGKMNRCTGHCCKRFYLPFSPTELQRAAEYTKTYWIGPDKSAVKDGWEKGWIDDTGKVHQRFFDEIEQIADMAIFIEKVALNANHEPIDHEAHWYTCKNFDVETGNCKVYETRPIMCRSFPNNPGGHCGYKACTKTPGTLTP